ncbi:hypothetical protein DFH09DRAFT_1420797 [Mycena vulgaris]|nr:hypothetical protein DFH09DRAFT_1420797 [Mycena vulgaris]
MCLLRSRLTFSLSCLSPPCLFILRVYLRPPWLLTLAHAPSFHVPVDGVAIMHVPMFHANDKLYVDPQSPDVGDVFLDPQDIPVGHERSEIKGGSVKPRLVHAPSLLHLDASAVLFSVKRLDGTCRTERTLKADLYSGPISLRQSARSIYEATAYRIPDSSNAAENHSHIMCMSDWDRRIGYRGLGMDKVVHGVAVVVVSVVTNCGEVVPIPRQTQDERPLSIGRWRDPGNPFRAVRGAGITRLARHDKDSGVSGKARGEGYTTVYRASDATLIIAPPQCPFRASNDKDRGNDSYPAAFLLRSKWASSVYAYRPIGDQEWVPRQREAQPMVCMSQMMFAGCITAVVVEARFIRQVLPTSDDLQRGSSLAGIIHPDGASSKWTIHITLSLPPNPNDVAINLADKQARYLAEIADADNVDECTPHVVRWGPPKLESAVPTVIIRYSGVPTIDIISHLTNNLWLVWPCLIYAQFAPRDRVDPATFWRPCESWDMHRARRVLGWCGTGVSPDKVRYILDGLLFGELSPSQLRGPAGGTATMRLAVW